MLEFAEEPLDCVAQFVERGEEAALGLAVRPVGDVRADALFFQSGDEAVGVIGLVGQHDRVGGDRSQNLRNRQEVMGLPRRE